jgi:hypothetical protein
MIDFEELTEEQILQKLLDPEKDDLPQKNILVKRLNLPITLKAVEELELEQLRKQCTQKKGKEEIFDQERYGYLIIVAGTVKPNWGDPRLLEKYKASGPEQVVRRILLPGEALQIGDEILNLSGYGEDAIEEIKK